MKNYIIKSLNGMALGLFSSLIVGLILKQIGSYTGIDALVTLGSIAQVLMGAGIGAGVAYSLGASPLVIYSVIIVGMIGSGSISQGTISIGEPVGALFSSVVGVELGRLINGRTKVDIILVPMVVITVGGLFGIYLSPHLASVMKQLGEIVNATTQMHPFFMGMFVSVVMGIILTLPISSAAIAISLGLSGLAGGASLVGCCCNMVGFAVISFRDNGFGGLIAQGLGTSMIQIPNIIKKPVIWIPAIVSSAILGVLSTMVFRLESSAVGAGMGTSGLVGPFGVIQAMGDRVETVQLLILILITNFVLPAVLSYLVYYPMYKKGIIKDGDMKLNVK